MSVDIDALTMTQTAAGLAASFRADDRGLALEVTHLAFGDAGSEGEAGGGYTPVGDETSLRRERARVAIGKGQRVDAHTIMVQAVLAADESFWGREIAAFDGDTMLAVWSHPSVPRRRFTAGQPTVAAYSLAFRALPANGVSWKVGAPEVSAVFDVEFEALDAAVATLARLVIELRERAALNEARIDDLVTAERLHIEHRARLDTLEAAIS